VLLHVSPMQQGSLLVRQLPSIWVRHVPKGTHCPLAAQKVEQHWDDAEQAAPSPVHEHAPQAHVVPQDCVPYVLPDGLHFCTAPGAHTPWPVQVPLCHVPVELQVSVSVPQLPHATCRVSPDVQAPQLPPEHDSPDGHGDAAPHCPQASHVATPLPEHSF
jgi:hypothetical protein